MLKELEPISKKLAEAHQIIYRTVSSLGEETEKTMVTDEWSVKDVIAHLAGAERGLLRTAKAMARGQDPQLPEGYNNDVFNAQQVAKRKTQTLNEVLGELMATHNEMAAFLDSITPEQLALMGEHPLEGEISLKDLLVVIYSHATVHCTEISNALRVAKK